jgi:hypothetical protein
MRFPIPAVIRLLPFALLAAPVDAEPRDPRKLTLTYDPLLVATRTFQLSIEYRPLPRWSGSLLLGGGGSVREASYFRQEQATWRHLGGQARWYPRPPGGIDPHAFAHAVWERAWYDDDARETFGDPAHADHAVTAAGWGWKFTHRKGLTFDAQLGLAVFFSKADGASPEAIGSPYVNLGLGWGFL